MGTTSTTTVFYEYFGDGTVSKTWTEIDGKLANSLAYTYGDNGQIETSTDQFGLVSQYIYDISGRTLEARRQSIDQNGDAVWLVSRRVYNIVGQLIWEQQEHVEANPDTAPMAAKGAFYTYDILGRAIKSEFFDEVLITISGKENNWSSAVVSTGALLTYTASGYDGTNKLIWEDDGTGVKTLYFYTPQGALSHMAIDLDGNLDTVDDQYSIAKNIYDEYGRQIQSIIDADGDLSTTADQLVTSIIYDSFDRPIKTIYADGTFTSTAYNELGYKFLETDRLGRTTYYEYDSAGRLSAVILPKVEHPATGEMVHVRYEYAYNSNGYQTSLRDNIFQTKAGDESTIDRSEQRETTFEYDWRGRQTSRILPDGSKEYFYYNALGQQQKHVSFEGRVTYFEYDKYERVSRITFFANQADFSNGMVTKAISYTYDQWSRVVKEIDSQNGTTSTFYDDDGNISEVVPIV